MDQTVQVYRWITTEKSLVWWRIGFDLTKGIRSYHTKTKHKQALWLGTCLLKLAKLLRRLLLWSRGILIHSLKILLLLYTRPGAFCFFFFPFLLLISLFIWYPLLLFFSLYFTSYLDLQWTVFVFEPGSLLSLISERWFYLVLEMCLSTINNIIHRSLFCDFLVKKSQNKIKVTEKKKKDSYKLNGSYVFRLYPYILTYICKTKKKYQ